MESLANLSCCTIELGINILLLKSTKIKELQQLPNKLLLNFERIQSVVCIIILKNTMLKTLQRSYCTYCDRPHRAVCITRRCDIPSQICDNCIHLKNHDEHIPLQQVRFEMLLNAIQKYFSNATELEGEFQFKFQHHEPYERMMITILTGYYEFSGRQMEEMYSWLVIQLQADQKQLAKCKEDKQKNKAEDEERIEMWTPAQYKPHSEAKQKRKYIRKKVQKETTKIKPAELYPVMRQISNAAEKKVNDKKFPRKTVAKKGQLLDQETLSKTTAPFLCPQLNMPSLTNDPRKRIYKEDYQHKDYKSFIDIIIENGRIFMDCSNIDEVEFIKLENQPQQQAIIIDEQIENRSQLPNRFQQKTSTSLNPIGTVVPLVIEDHKPLMPSTKEANLLKMIRKSQFWVKKGYKCLDQNLLNQATLNFKKAINPLLEEEFKMVDWYIGLAKVALTKKYTKQVQKYLGIAAVIAGKEVNLEQLIVQMLKIDGRVTQVLSLYDFLYQHYSNHASKKTILLQKLQYLIYFTRLLDQARELLEQNHQQFEQYQLDFYQVQLMKQEGFINMSLPIYERMLHENYPADMKEVIKIRLTEISIYYGENKKAHMYIDSINQKNLKDKDIKCYIMNYLRAVCYRNLNRYDEALFHAHRALAVTDKPEYYFEVAMNLQEKKEFYKSAVNFLKALNFDKTFYQAQLGLLESYYHLGAKAYFMKIYEVYCDTKNGIHSEAIAAFLNLCGNLKTHENRPKESLQYYRLALEFLEDNEYYINIADTYESLNMKKQALMNYYYSQQMVEKASIYGIMATLCLEIFRSNRQEQKDPVIQHYVLFAGLHFVMKATQMKAEEDMESIEKELEKEIILGLKLQMM